ncbi:MAG: L-fucose:H+ symporter permease [Prevotella sp.]|nr:L-fucose:H+ symporter permease [Prevotella sp.]
MSSQSKIQQFFQHHDKGYFVAFVLITACFALWGFANNVTTPMVGAFSRIFRISTTEATLVTIAFNLGYFCMAFPAALIIQRYSYKTGILTGLGLYALGTILFVPSRYIGDFYPFLFAYFILTCGLSFLETTCHPYIYDMGSERHAIQRLNAVQSFNALGTLGGMLLAMGVHKGLSPMSSEERLHLPMAQFNILKNHDLGVLIQPYIYICALVIIILIAIVLTKIPNDDKVTATGKGTLMRLRELLNGENYREGVIAQFCYVGAQVSCWTYIIQYGMRVFTAEGMSEQAASVLTMKYNIVAICLFAAGRFVCTWLMQWFTPARMLSTLAILGVTALIGVICFTNRSGLYCLVAVSGCLSLMFPTIYGYAVKGLGDNIKIAGAGLIMAILGGSVFPPLQAAILESNITFLGTPSTNASFLIPMICLGVVAWYGHRAYVRFYINSNEEETPLH